MLLHNAAATGRRRCGPRPDHPTDVEPCVTFTTVSRPSAAREHVPARRRASAQNGDAAAVATARSPSQPSSLPRRGGALVLLRLLLMSGVRSPTRRCRTRSRHTTRRYLSWCRRSTRRRVIAATVRSLAASDYPSRLRSSSSTTGRPITPPLSSSGSGCPACASFAGQTGKAGALNAAIASARHDIIVSVDADTVFERETVGARAAVSARRRCGGRQHEGRQPRSRLGRWQHIEYVIGFNLDRRLYDVSAASHRPGRRRRVSSLRLLQDVGVSEHARRRHRPHHRDQSSRLARGIRADPRSYRAPESLRALWRQRYRWSTEPCSRSASTGTPS